MTIPNEARVRIFSAYVLENYLWRKLTINPPSLLRSIALGAEQPGMSEAGTQIYSAHDATHEWVTSSDNLHRTGYWGLVVLLCLLPFELTQRPIVQTHAFTITNLKLIYYLVAGLAGVSVIRTLPPFAGRTLRVLSAFPQYVRYRRIVGVIFLCLLVASALSSLQSAHPSTGLKWTADLMLGGLVWLALPLWLRNNTERKVSILGLAILAGAVVAALLGLAEVGNSQRMSIFLEWFRVKPTVMGSHVRLSGTFAYANIAALYFEVALFFASINLMRFLHQVPRRWGPVVATVAAIDVLLAALVLTYSRGAVLGLGAGLATMALASRRHWNLSTRRIPWWVPAIALSFLLAVAVTTVSAGSLTMLRLTTQSDQDWYRASFTSTIPQNLRAREVALIPVTIHNVGPLTWSALGTHRFDLGYHWLYPSRRVADFNGLRTSLQKDLDPGGTQTLTARVLTPVKAGRYLLVWDIAQEGVTWFSLKSAFYQALPVRILPNAGVGERMAPSSSAPTNLPTTLAEPTRQQLWAAAVRMIRNHPILGVGPDSYRLTYGAYMRPPRRSWDTRILANSLPLEVLADLGLIGGGLFLGFLAMTVWWLGAAVWRGRVVNLWEVGLAGALAAFLGHGLVDYILKSNAIFILFWILCGFAATAACLEIAMNPSRHPVRDLNHARRH